ncbi:MAG TPA: HepT-like ribonuclease domain-containing protein [Longimicrobiaceae bacterium]|nr:HepT-like ribonuclease domain-containing protein [Longimicrobiaceae bacterium]
MTKDGPYIVHILECIRRIEVNIADGRETFFSSHTLQDAVLRNLQTMSESTQRLSPAAKGRHPEVQWKGISGFRNVLVHDYFGVNLHRVWEIIEEDVPILKRAAESLSVELS